jgi:hypothetical protein
VESNSSLLERGFITQGINLKQIILMPTLVANSLTMPTLVAQALNISIVLFTLVKPIWVCLQRFCASFCAFFAGRVTFVSLLQETTLVA